MSNAPGWGAVSSQGGTLSGELPQRIIWLDPGKITGWASWRLTACEFESGQFPFAPLGEWLRRYLCPATWLGWEAYTVRPGGAHIKFQPDSLEVIGMARWLAYHQNARVLPPQQPGDRVLGARHLRAVRWVQPGQNHANDAAAHLLAFLLGNALASISITSRLSGDGDVPGRSGK